MPFDFPFYYDFSFTAKDGMGYFISIYDVTSAETGAINSNATDLSGDPLRITIINNEEDKFSPIRGKQCTIQFLSNSQINLSSFATGKWLVEVRYGIGGGVLPKLFLGYLVLDDMRQEFLSNEANCIVTLTATDSLGLLKDIPLTDSADLTPRGKYKISQYLAMCLAKTGMDLPIKVINSIYEVNNQNIPYYESVYVEAKTFEAEIGESEDCYTVLSKILAQQCYLTQYNGSWYIVRVDEVERDAYKVHNFTTGGDYVNSETVAIIGTIGSGLPMSFEGRSTDVVLQRPIKEGKIIYNFDLPKEIVDNIDFTRGDEYVPLTFPANTIYYEINDWTVKSGLPGSGATPTSIAYIVRKYDDLNYEIERYVEIVKPTAAQSFPTHIESNSLPLHEKDRFSFSIDYRFNATIDDLSDEKKIATIRLEGEDGSKWWLVNVLENNTYDPLAQAQKWFQTSADWSSFTTLTHVAILDSDGENWQSYLMTAPPLPVTGNVIVALYNIYTVEGSGDNVNINYQNLQFNYNPYINGSYQKYRGQQHKITQDLDENNINETQVFLSDSDKKLFKGALLKYGSWTEFYYGAATISAPNTFVIFGNHTTNIIAGKKIKIELTAQNDNVYTVTSSAFDGTYTIVVVVGSMVDEIATARIYKQIENVYSLVNGFYNGADIAIPGDITERMGYIQAFDVWNQKRRVMRKFEFAASLTPGTDMVHQLLIESVSVHATNKRFSILHFEQDYKNAFWSGAFVEAYDETLAKEYFSTHEFKYITER